jgi:hypothetical protein
VFSLSRSTPPQAVALIRPFKETTGSGIAVSIVTMLRDERHGFDFCQGREIFLFTTAFKQALSPYSLLSKGYRGSFPGGKADGE